MTSTTNPIDVRHVAVRDLVVQVAIAGAGPPLLLLHGFPHTWEAWSRVIPDLARHHRVIAPDLRGLGGTTRAVGGYDLESLAGDAIGLLDALEVGTADVMAMDAGAPVAFLLGLTHPDRVRRLVLMEAILGDLPRPDAAPAPWWFGFHGVPGLAERAVEGNEETYIGFFLDHAVEHDPIEPSLRERLIDAYRGHESLRCAFEVYRAFPTNAAQLREALKDRRLTMPTLAIGAKPIGAGLAAQLAPVTDHLSDAVIERCGHLVPLDCPRELLALVEPFLRG